MDLDTTLRNLPLTEEQILEALCSVCEIDLNDEVTFIMKSVVPIRKDDVYGGYCVRLDAVYDTIITPLSIDVSAGDIITPSAVKYEFVGIFDENVKITLWGYNIETVMAEKISTNADVQNMWSKYQKMFSYAKDITFESIIHVLKKLLK